MAVTYFRYLSRLWTLVISVPQSQPCVWWFVPWCLVTALLSVVLSCRWWSKLLCCQSYNWSISVPCGWYISIFIDNLGLFFFWDVISPTLNTQLEDQVLRYICPLPCDLHGLVKPPRSVSPCRDSSQSHWGNQATPPSEGNSTLGSGYHDFSVYAPFCTEWLAQHPAFSRQLPF